MSTKTNDTIKIHRKGFAVIPNEFIQNPEISPLARFFGCYIHSKPEDWIIRLKHIKSEFGWGQTVWEKISRELRKAGYMRLIPHKRGFYLSFCILREFDDKEPDFDKLIHNPTFDFASKAKCQPGKIKAITNKRIVKKNISNKQTKQDLLVNLKNIEELDHEEKMQYEDLTRMGVQHTKALEACTILPVFQIRDAFSSLQDAHRKNKTIRSNAAYVTSILNAHLKTARGMQ